MSRVELPESPFTLKYQPCEKCGSIDAKSYRADGSAFCFSCQSNFKRTGDTPIMTTETTTDFDFVDTINSIGTYKSYPLTSRKITKKIVDHFNVKMETSPDGKPTAHYYPYTKDGQVVAYKKRTLPKDFSVVGNIKHAELFGQSQATNGKTLVITEGELDAMSVAQAYLDHYGKVYAVVSIPSASMTNSILENRDFVRKFQEVVLMFDQDEAGKAATEKAAKIIGTDKVKIAKFQTKTLQIYTRKVVRMQSCKLSGVHRSTALQV